MTTDRHETRVGFPTRFLLSVGVLLVSCPFSGGVVPDWGGKGVSFVSDDSVVMGAPRRDINEYLSVVGVLQKDTPSSDRGSVRLGETVSKTRR